MSDSTDTESGRTAFRVAAVVLLVLVVAPFVVTGVPSVIGAEESFVVLSGSMNAEPEPIVKPGDVVIVDGVDPANVEEGDILTFTTGAEEPVTHRVVNVTEQDGRVAFRTKGDANEDADPRLVDPDQVIGEVMLVIPLIGHVINFANTTQGFVLLVLLPIGLLVLSEAWNLVTAGEDPPDEEVAREPTGSDRSVPVGTRGAMGATDAGGGVEDGDDGDDEGTSTVSVGRTQVGWTAAGLVPIVASAGYVAFRLQEAWILTLFFAATGLLVLSTLLYLRIRWSSEPSGAEPVRPAAHPGGAVGRQSEGDVGPGEERPAATTVARTRVFENGTSHDPVVNGRIDGTDTDSLVEVAVESRATLVGMAIEKGSWVVHDPDVAAYVLVDDGVLFRYDYGDTGGSGGSGPDRSGTATGADPNGTAAGESAPEWGAASGWVTFPEDGDGTAPEEVDGADGSDLARSDTGGLGVDARDRDGGDGESRETATEAGSTAADTDGSSETNETTDWVPTPPDLGDVPSSDTNGDGSTSSWGDEAPIPVVRRVDDSSARSAENDRRVAEDPVKTDGGTNPELPSVVGGLESLADLFIRVFEFVGFVMVEPPAALYRTLLSNDRENESGSGTEGSSGEER